MNFMPAKARKWPWWKPLMGKRVHSVAFGSKPEFNGVVVGRVRAGVIVQDEQDGTKWIRNKAEVQEI